MVTADYRRKIFCPLWSRPTADSLPVAQRELMRFGENQRKQPPSGREEDQRVEDQSETDGGERLNAAAGFRLVFIR